MKATFGKMPVRALRAKLRATDWKVLLAIAVHADKNGRAWPSMETIAAMAGINRSNVPRALNRLERCGLLRRHHVRKGSGWQANYYELVFEPLPDVITQDDTASADGVSSPVTTGVITADALTDQGTDSLPERRVSVVVGNRRGVITHDDRGADMGGVAARRNEQLPSGKPNGATERAWP